MAEDKITIYGELESGVPGGVVMSLKKNVTYEELLSLRNQSRLQPGMQYRITDYATVCKETTDYISAGNVFDVVVTADTSSTLKEDAAVMHREGDTYFAHCDLSAWKIKYCLDNDTSRFNWVPGDEAEAAMFDGYAYQRKPEEDKTIGNYTYIAWYNANNTSAPLVYSLSTDPKPNRCVAFFWDSFYSEMVGEATFGVYREAVRYAKGVIYWMRDEWGNETAYDFKNIRFKTERVLHGETVPDLLGEYCYTFETGPVDIGDASVSQFYAVKNNVIKASGDFNYIVFYTNAQDNFFDEGCSRIYIRSGSVGNKFGIRCFDIIVGTSSFCNVFEGFNIDIHIGMGCEYNIFKNGGTSITTGTLCKNNVFSALTGNISIGDGSSRNYFGCSSMEIYLGRYCSDNYFGSAVQRVRMYYKEGSAPASTLLDWVCNSHFEDRVVNVQVYLRTMPSSENRLQNMYFHAGEYRGLVTDIDLGQNKVTVSYDRSAGAIVEYGLSMVVPHVFSSAQTRLYLETLGNGSLRWIPEYEMAKRILQTYKNVEFFDGIKDGVLANIVEAVSVMKKIDGIYYYKGRKCFVAKSGDNFYMSWGNMQSTVHDYNEGGLAIAARVFSDGAKFYIFDGNDLVEYNP